MEVLKITSIRLSINDIVKADVIAKNFCCCGRSTALRAAVWIGLKILTSKNIGAILHLMWLDENRKGVPSEGEISLEDVLRTAGVSKE